MRGSIEPLRRSFLRMDIDVLLANIKRSKRSIKYERERLAEMIELHRLMVDIYWAKKKEKK